MSYEATSLKRPKLRPLEIIPVSARGEDFFLFRDRHGFSEDAALPQAFGPLLRLMDGKRTQSQIIADFAGLGGEMLTPEFLDKILSDLDSRFLLDSPHFRDHKSAIVSEFTALPVRPASLAGSAYPADGDELLALLDRLYRRALTLERTDLGTPSSKGGRIRGCIVPHIDFTRGGTVEALAYMPLLNEHFDILVILGIAHGGVQYPFCLAPKDFETPIGTAQYAREFGDALQICLGNKLAAEQWAHKSEHSVEFVAVFLQHAEKLKNAQIVPIICGGFFDEIRTGESPSGNPHMAEFSSALREVTEEFEARGQRVGFIVSVDGAHVGSQFGDDAPLTPQRLQQIRDDDLDFWRTVERGDMKAMHAHISRDDNARNVDAHPAVYALFSAFPEMRARMQRYDQAYSAEQNIVVSFAALTLLG